MTSFVMALLTSTGFAAGYVGAWALGDFRAARVHARRARARAAATGVCLLDIEGVAAVALQPADEVAWIVRRRGLTWTRRMSLETQAQEALGSRWQVYVVTSRANVPVRLRSFL